MNECRDRIEDAVFAVRAAIEEGVVIGGGCSLFYASQSEEFQKLKSNEKLSEEQKMGILIVAKCSEQPLRKIYSNSHS